MPLVADRVAQLTMDKMADTWVDTVAAQARVESFYEVISDTGDPDVETDIGPGAETADVNITSGLEFHPIVKELMQGFLAHVSDIGGYGTIRQYMAARRFRAHRYMSERCWADAAISSNFVRAGVFAEQTSIASYLHGTGATDIGDIPSEAGGARMRALVAVKGAVNAWLPDIHAVCEGPETTLDGGITSIVTTIALVDSSVFPATGYVMIEDECVEYTGNVANELTGCVRASYGTVAAAHTTGAAVYLVQTFTPSIRISARPGLMVDLDEAYLDAVSEEGSTGVHSTGIGGAGTLWDEGSHALLLDPSCPELLTEDCLTDDHLHVADASAFRAGDHIRIVDGTPTDEWATIHDVDQAEGLIGLDAATTGNFATADTAFVGLAFCAIDEGAPFAYDDFSLTVDADAGDAADGLPASGTLLIDDEQITYDSILADVITITPVTGRGANGTVAVTHENGVPVMLLQEGTFPGHNEWGIVGTVAADALTMDDALLHSYFTCARVVPLLRDVVLIEVGTDGDAADLATVVAFPDRDVANAG